MDLNSDVVELLHHLEYSVEYLSNVNFELESVHNVVDLVCIDYICANRALNGSDSENSLLYKRLEKWRHQVGQIAQILSLHRENKFAKSHFAEKEFMEQMGTSDDTINGHKSYEDVLKFKRGILALKFAGYFARKSNNLAEMIGNMLIEADKDPNKYKHCLHALSEISKIFKYVISDSAIATSMKKGGESVFANNILRQFLKISIDATEAYTSSYTSSSELALVELIKYIPVSSFVDNYDKAVKSAKSINYEADESPITFYLFNLEKKGGVGDVIEKLLKNKGVVNLVKNYIHSHDVHAYYFNIKTTRDLLEKIHNLQKNLIQTTILDYSLKIIHAILAIISNPSYPSKNLQLNEAIYRSFVAVTFMINWQDHMLANVWDGQPFIDNK